MKRTYKNPASTFLAACLLGFLSCEEPESPKPEITTISPPQGAIGSQVNISGKNFSTFQSLQFGSTSSSSVASKTDVEIITVVPSGLSPGPITVTVKTTGGASNAISFTVLPGEPEITSIEPDRAAVGMTIVVKGKNLSTASFATFGTISISSFITKSETEVKLLVPEGLSPGNVDVTIASAGGMSEKATFTVVGKPTITSLSPAIGPAGRLISIAGTFFDEPAKVFFGEGEASSISIRNATLIEAIVPVSATTGKVKVATAGGEAFSAADFVLKGAPLISSFTPPSGIVGTAVTLNGQNFDAGSAVVKFGAGAATEVTLVSATQIIAKIPTSGTSGKITVETAAGSGSSQADFAVIGAPVVSTFTPTSGLAGAEVIISGSNFIDVSSIKVGNSTVGPSNYTILSQTQIKTRIPEGAATGKISVITAAGTGTSGTNFTVLIPPSITSFSPGNGTQGSNVVITGEGFTDITSVRFNEAEVGAGNFTVNSATQITTKVPNNATSGKIKVTNALGVASSVSSFYVTPFISSLSPAAGSSGTNITINGTNLEAAKVKFNSTEVTPMTNSSTTITVMIPNIGTGAVDLRVINQGGTSNVKPFTVTEPVVLTEIVATANIVGQLLLLKGTNLLGASKVLFGNVEANIVTNTSTVVTTIIPTSLIRGSYAVKLITSKGTSNGKVLEILNVQNPDTGGPSLVNGATVTSLPAGYVPPVANFWTNVNNPNEGFLLGGSGTDTGTLTVLYRTTDGTGGSASGTGLYDKINNYVEFTLKKTPNEKGIRYIGVWNRPSSSWSYHYMTLISTESGKQLEISVAN